MKKLFLFCAFVAFAVLPALAADNPWVGTWKLDPAKSHFTGDTFTFSKASNGMMHFTDGSTLSYDFGVDGKPYKTHDDRTASWASTGDNAWESVIKAGDNTLSTDHYTLSPDSKTLNITYSGTKPDGTSFNDEAVYKRLTGTKGLAGKWQSTKIKISAPGSFVITSSEPDAFHWDIPDYKMSVDGKADGSDLPLTGPTVAPNSSISVKMLSPRKISYTMKEGGKPVAMGIQTLAADSKSFTDVSWSPGKMSEKQTALFVKQ